MTGVCQHCGRAIHWYIAGWLHDDDNFATCLRRLWYGDGHLVTAEPV